ncbi:hypothetical protein P3W45_000540 [Vairimorpha bombi]|jgi:ribonuclease PH
MSYREDGRKISEIRRININHSYPYTTLIQGNTHIKVNIDGPKEGNKLNINVSYSKTSRQEQASEKRTYEYENELYSIFDQIILTDRQIDIAVEIVQEDGSILSSMVNCIALSLCHSNVPLCDYPCGITYSNLGVDLSGSEEGGRHCVIIVVYLMNTGKIIYYKSIGKITMEKIQSINEMGREGIYEIYKNMKEFLIRE